MALELRTYIIVDSLQPQMASYLSTISRGYFPVAFQTSCVIEIAPGISLASDVLERMDFAPAISPQMKLMPSSVFA